MTNPSSSHSLPWTASRRTPRLSGGTAGDIPLTASHLTLGVLCWSVWAAVCWLALWATGAQAQTLAWAAPTVPSAATAPGADNANAGTPVTPPQQQVLQGELETLLRSATAQVAQESSVISGKQPRVEIVLGRLDPRLKLAPCDKVRAYMPEGAKLWGRTRVGLRCEQGPVAWNVYWPLTVKVWAPAVVAVVPLRPGSIMSAADLRLSEVDLAESNSPAVLQPKEVIGRSVLRVIEPGQGLRQDDVRMRRWFAAGEPVRLMVKGDGFAIAAEGLALSHGDEGQCARVRVDSGKVLCALPFAQRQAEVTM